jgi:hypothetical protein
MSKYIPKIGDKVIITKSHFNWNDVGKIEKFVGKLCTITGFADEEDPVESKVYLSSDEVDGLDEWYWCYGHGHFKPTRKELKIKINF